MKTIQQIKQIKPSERTVYEQARLDGERARQSYIRHLDKNRLLHRNRTRMKFGKSLDAPLTNRGRKRIYSNTGSHGLGGEDFTK